MFLLSYQKSLIIYERDVVESFLAMKQEGNDKWESVSRVGIFQNKP